jgi:hypothetical protein
VRELSTKIALEEVERVEAREEGPIADLRGGTTGSDGPTFVLATAAGCLTAIPFVGSDDVAGGVEDEGPLLGRPPACAGMGTAVEESVTSPALECCARTGGVRKCTLA